MNETQHIRKNKVKQKEKPRTHEAHVEDQLVAAAFVALLAVLAFLAVWSLPGSQMARRAVPRDGGGPLKGVRVALKEFRFLVGLIWEVPKTGGAT